MSKITDAFKNGKAFIPFITAGDPSLDVTEQLILEMDKSGADIIEVGIPFSDPVAEGIVIQEADLRALSAGTTTDKIFNMLKNIKDKVNCALAIMTYINPIYAYGSEKFLSNCNECGVSAVIVPDIPFEEKEVLKPACDKYGVEFVSFVAPTSHDRIKMIAKGAHGFVYCVSSLGVTGVREEIRTDISEMIDLVKSVKDIPCAIGFGISTPEQAQEMARYADGIIVGSAIVKICAKYGKDCVPHVAEYVKSMKDAISSM
ncbi:MAG: tryptophan synthase subunit alpha [Oscillospiraceae bacterium]|nr:tryptophan synthase subunit alpha [Oscillospiraceae bacterium]